VVGPDAEVGPGARVVGSFLGPRAQVSARSTVTAALVPTPERPTRPPR